MTTEVIVTAEFAGWYEALEAPEQSAIRRTVSLLEEFGATLGFPHSSAIAGSQMALRELRVQYAGDPYRVLYVFDPARQAVLLVGGNKAGKGNRWYESAIRTAERLYAEYLKDKQWQ